MSKKITIVGGGAAGFFAAITCAEANPDNEVLILEAGREVLAKVKISGGGRCNVTHACFTPKELTAFYPRGSRELLGPFHTFCTGDTIEWFENRGVPLKIEEDGRMFPQSDSSESIMNCLIESAEKAGVELRKKSRVEAIQRKERKWELSLSGEKIITDKLMMATGSSPSVWKKLATLGHAIVEPVPSLFTFNIRDPRIKDLLGLSISNATIKVSGTKLSASGPLLITHWGMSGPAILRLSAWGARELNDRKYNFQIVVNFTGTESQESIKEAMDNFKKEEGKKQISSNPKFGIPSRLWKRLVASSNIREDQKWADINKERLSKLQQQLTQATFGVNGKSTFKDEFVTAGGVKLSEINFKKMESKLFPGLFFAGEVLNIDAITGGFNFQAAWTGGFIAGNAMAQSDSC